MPYQHRRRLKSGKENGSLALKLKMCVSIKEAYPLRKQNQTCIVGKTDILQIMPDLETKHKVIMQHSDINYQLNAE